MVDLKDPMPSDIFHRGQVLNNTYEIKGVLGRGGTGEVYLAHNQISERIIAIKALNAQFSGNDDYVELMKREEQMRNIVHDAVVRYTECSRSDVGHVFIVMDYVEGPSLNDVMFDHGLEDRDLLIVAHRVLEGLEATHARGIVHRDLSPDNIILRGGEPHQATIIDFGIAKDTATGARTIVGNEFAGKYEYAAPEQLEGKSEFRTDLYSLGVSLLAAKRRQIPDVGRTPGEIFRAKQEVLDTSGVRPPLKDLIEWLTAPNPEDRPQNTADALQRLSKMLKPLEAKEKARGKGKSENSRRGGVPVMLIALAVIVVAGVGAFAAGLIPNPFGSKLPVVSPYTLNANLDATGEYSLGGYAPDEESSDALLASFASAAGASAPPGSITLADGMPNETWPNRVADLMGLVTPLEFWSVSVEDNAASVAGLAPTLEQRRQITDQLDLWDDIDNMSVSYEIVAGPKLLNVEDVRLAILPNQTCGSLEVSFPKSGPAFDLFETVSITGNLANAADADALQSLLAPMLGDRDLRMDTVALNDQLCAIRAVLPPAPAQAVSIALSNGETGQSSLTGVFRTDENPVVDIQIPETIEEAHLWVMVVDNSGKVFHILPNINLNVHDVDMLGVIENGVRRIRVLWSIEEFLEDQTRLAMQVTDEDFGMSEVIAILSSTPLFNGRRPRDESVNSVAEAVQETLLGREGDVIGVASRIIDARP